MVPVSETPPVPPGVANYGHEFYSRIFELLLRLKANIDKLGKIINIQRKILTEELNPDVTKIPQLWCLYKEVQDYYNAGMRIPDDVTLLWAEDNWGNLRRVPSAGERTRTGGAGIYYHFDYHGGPRSYQWINTNPISKIWDQMSLAKQYGADRVWIVNVGHFRGYEFPIEYFMSLAWNGGTQNFMSLQDMMGFTEGGLKGRSDLLSMRRLLISYQKIQSIMVTANLSCLIHPLTALSTMRSQKRLKQTLECSKRKPGKSMIFCRLICTIHFIIWSCFLLKPALS
jgi:hypothetical protein